MTFTQHFFFCLLILCLISCQDKTELELAEETALISPDDIDLRNGISQYFTAEEIDEYKLDDLNEIDGMLKDIDGLKKNIVKHTQGALIVRDGSVNAIQKAIDLAGDRNSVLLEAGTHYVSGTLKITNDVDLIGEDGAKLIIDVKPIEETGSVQPGIHLYGATRAAVINLHIEAKNDPGGTAILVDRSPKALIYGNNIEGFQMGVLVNNKENSFIINNVISTSLAGLAGELFDAYGIVVMNGNRTRLIGNESNDGIFGIWMCGENGLAMKNSTSGNFIGHIFCKVPDEAFLFPSGELIGSSVPATNWLAHCNEAHGNFDAGFILIDGARRNYLKANFTSSNGTYDIELTGDSERFGIFTPRSEFNRVRVAGKQTVKNCGYANYVQGGVMIDTNTDPCF